MFIYTEEMEQKIIQIIESVDAQAQMPDNGMRGPNDAAKELAGVLKNLSLGKIVRDIREDLRKNSSNDSTGRIGLTLTGSINQKISSKASAEFLHFFKLGVEGEQTKVGNATLHVEITF